MTVIRTEIPFIIGYKLGSLSRQVEMVIETANKRSGEKVRIKVFRIYESLKYVLDEITLIDISEHVRDDISEYLDSISGGKLSLEREIAFNKTPVIEEDKRLFGKIKKKIDKMSKSQDRVLKNSEVRELDLKLKLWKDRIVSDLLNLPDST